MGPGRDATHHIGLCSFVGGEDPAGDAREYIHKTIPQPKIPFFGDLLDRCNLLNASKLNLNALFCSLSSI